MVAWTWQKIGVIVIAIFAFVIMVWGGFDVLTSGKDMLLNRTINISMGKEELAEPPSIPLENKVEVLNLHETMDTILKGDNNCFSNYKGFSDFGKGGASISLVYDALNNRTDFKVLGGPGGEQLVTIQDDPELRFNIENMRPCVIAGKVGNDIVAQQFDNKFLNRQTEASENYYVPVDSVEISYDYGMLKFDENKITYTVNGTSYGPYDFEAHDWLFSPDNEHICFFPTVDGNYGCDGSKENGLDDDCFVDYDEDVSIPRQFREGTLEPCGPGPGEEFLSFDVVELASTDHIEDEKCLFGRPAYLHQGLINQVGDLGGAEWKVLDEENFCKNFFPNSKSDQGCMLFSSIKTEGDILNTKDCAWSVVEEGSIISSLFSESYRPYYISDFFVKNNLDATCNFLDTVWQTKSKFSLICGNVGDESYRWRSCDKAVLGEKIVTRSNSSSEAQFECKLKDSKYVWEKLSGPTSLHFSKYPLIEMVGDDNSRFFDDYDKNDCGTEDFYLIFPFYEEPKDGEYETWQTDCNDQVFAWFDHMRTDGTALREEATEGCPLAFSEADAVSNGQCMMIWSKEGTVIDSLDVDYLYENVPTSDQITDSKIAGGIWELTKTGADAGCLLYGHKWKSSDERSYICKGEEARFEDSQWYACEKRTVGMNIEIGLPEITVQVGAYGSEPDLSNVETYECKEETVNQENYYRWRKVNN